MFGIASSFFHCLTLDVWMVSVLFSFSWPVRSHGNVQGEKRDGYVFYVSEFNC